MGAWPVITVIAALAAAAILRALRSGPTAGPDDTAARVAVWRSRLRELDTDAAGGVIDAARHADARRELEDAAALELEAATAATAPPRRMGWAAAVTTALAVPAVAVMLYAALGTPVEPAAPDLHALVVELDARLADAPDDLQGQMLLGRSRVVLGDYAGAVRAWRAAQRLAPADPTVLANLAEALVLADATALQGEAAVLLEAVLDQDADNPKALWYGGLAAEARGERALAAHRWRALLAQEPPEVLREVLARRIAAAETQPFALTVTVALAPSLPRPADAASLFVTAHAGDGAGPPLAAVRVPVSAWPLEITLTERSAMVAGTDLAAHDELVVVARVSASGLAARQPGDLVGTARWRRGEDARVVIDEVIE